MSRPTRHTTENARNGVISRGNSTRHIRGPFVFAAFLLLPMSLATGGAGINFIAPDPETTDIDGDGYVSSFTLAVSANTDVNERGKAKKKLHQRGEPVFIIEFPQSNGLGTIKTHFYQKVDAKSGLTVNLRFPQDSMITYINENERAMPEYSNDAEIGLIRVILIESDGTVSILINNKNEVVDKMILDLDEPIRLEPPEDDALAKVSFNSEPGGAVVYLGGEKLGTTPVTKELPVDFVERNGEDVAIRLEKDGYKTFRAKELVRPPMSRTYRLENSAAKLSLKSEPSGATVFVNGKRAGETPFTKTYATNRRLDVRLESDQHRTKRIRDIATPYSRTVSLKWTEAAAKRAAEFAKRAQPGNSKGRNLEGLQQAEKIKDVARQNVDLGDLISEDHTKEGKVSAARERQVKPEGLAKGTPVLPGRAAKDLAKIGGEKETDFTGTWRTNFGQLRLYQVSGYVIGDYARNGLILGKLDGRTLDGIFTNGARNGIFRFKMDGNGAFSGSWAWHGESLDDGWAGERTTAEPPERYRNFTPGEATNTQSPTDRTVYDGTYRSQHGTVELIARDQFLIGDYGDKGVLAGIWDGDSFIGQFTDGGKTGWFDFRFFSKNGNFRDGKRGWIESGPTDPEETAVPGDEWILERTSGATPRPDQMAAHQDGGGKVQLNAKGNLPLNL